MECIKIVTDENYEVSDEAYHTLKRIAKGCEKLLTKESWRSGKRNGKGR